MPLNIERLNEDLFVYKVSIGAVGEIISYSDTEFVSLVEEASKLSAKATVHVDPFTPPAADFTEIAVQIAISGSIEALRFVISRWFGQNGSAIRTALAEITKNARATPSGRRFVPLELRVGGVSFMFPEVLTADELLSRFEAAQEIVLSVSEEDLASSEERRNWVRTYSWDTSTLKWAPMPDRALDRNPADLL